MKTFTSPTLQRLTNPIVNFIERSLDKHPLPWRATADNHVVASDGFPVLECNSSSQAQDSIRTARWLAGEISDAEIDWVDDAQITLPIAA